MATKAQTDKLDLDLKIATIEKTQAELSLLTQQTIKTFKEARWYPVTVIMSAMIATGALLGAGAALAKVFMP